MQPFTEITAIAAPFLQANVDTDTIIRPKRRWPPPTNTELGAWAFAALRYLPDGQPNLDFILNQPPYNRAQILLCGRNFGCGSSRENAVTSLAATGLRCFIAPSYGAIFYNNCFQNGLLPIELPEDVVANLAESVASNPQNNLLTVNLYASTVALPKQEPVQFDIDPLRRDALLEGIDDVNATMRLNNWIEDFRNRDAVERPWLY